VVTQAPDNFPTKRAKRHATSSPGYYSLNHPLGNLRRTTGASRAPANVAPEYAHAIATADVIATILHVSTNPVPIDLPSIIQIVLVQMMLLRVTATPVATAVIPIVKIVKTLHGKACRMGFDER